MSERVVKMLREKVNVRIMNIPGVGERVCMGMSECRRVCKRVSEYSTIEWVGGCIATCVRACVRGCVGGQVSTWASEQVHVCVSAWFTGTQTLAHWCVLIDGVFIIHSCLRSHSLISQTHS